MVGRAGRPQFDTEGVAVIMTQKEVRAGVGRGGCQGRFAPAGFKLRTLFTALHRTRAVCPPNAVVPRQTRDRYTNLLSGSEAVESCLHQCFGKWY